MNELELISIALNYAKNELGIKIIRGYLFDWNNPIESKSPKFEKLPSKCNAIGALLLYYGNPIKDFYPGWFDELCKTSELKPSWIWRFVHGWDYGNQLNFTFVDKETKKERVETDRVSRDANKLALKWTKP